MLRMRRFNIHIFSVLAVIGAFCYYGLNSPNETVLFYGFAQNKETEVRIPHGAVVQKINVQVGQKVSQGDILLEVSRSELTQQKNDISADISSLESQNVIWEASQKAAIRTLKAEKAAKISEVDFQIKEIKSRLDINSQLIKDLKSISRSDVRSNNDPIQIRIKALEDEKAIHVERIDNEIRKIENELFKTSNPTKIAIKKLKGQLHYANKEEHLLKVVAPEDGVVGSVVCKIGENIPAFTNFLTIYDDNPTMIKGYVLESLEIQVKKGDELYVLSAHDGNESVNGKVIGLGSKISEIPERLRRNPMIKTFGQEVVISISPDNAFLQNEKVILKLEKENSSLKKFHLAEIFSTN